MYYSDKPIDAQTEDKLGRVNFSKQLARAIVSLNVEESFCIGLFGEWGCGKTSVLNMAIQEINELAKDIDYESRPIVVQFNPWNFSDNGQLLSQFFSAISLQLRTDEKNKKLATVGDAIEQYSTALAYTEYIPLIGKYLKLIPTLTKTFGTKIKTEAQKELNDAGKQKSTVAAALKQQKHKIIVVIDDIDRLSNDQIRQIFQLVNTVACFPNIIYVLSFDKDIVVRALEKVQDFDGNKYLEKIIQVPFSLPSLSKESLWNIFFERLDKAMNGTMYQFISREYWASTFWDSIAPFINDLRDVNRIINAFQFKLALLGEEVNYADLIAITAIETMMPDVYSWIIGNKGKLVGGRPFDNLTDEQQRANERHYIDKFRNYDSGLYRPRDVINSLSALFPKFANTVGYNIRQSEEEELICDLRIAQDKLFNLYFSLSTDGVSISRSELNETIFNMTEENLKKYMIMMSDNMVGMDYLMELKSNLRKIPYERIEIFIRALLETSMKLTGSYGASGIKLTAFQYAEQCIFRLLQRIENVEQRYTIILGCIVYGSVDCMQAIAAIIYKISKAYGRFGTDNIDERDKIVTEQQLNELLARFMLQVIEFGNSFNILDMQNNQMIVYLWDAYDRGGLERYLIGLLQDDLNKLKFVTLYCNRKTSKGSEKRYYYDNGYQDFIDNQTIIEVIQNTINDGRFYQLEERIRYRIAAFINWNNGNVNEEGYVLDSSVIATVNEMKMA